MNRIAMIVLSLAAPLCIASSAAFAQDAPPTYQADPSVYKVIFEDQNFRVIAATYRAGQTDKAHSHPVPSIAYALADCAIRTHAPDGKTRDIDVKAGTVNAVPITPSHTTENAGSKECQVIFVERK
jgi:mannose-6-phosphate isomerase-like protein (cupin superfamily)